MPQQPYKAKMAGMVDRNGEDYYLLVSEEPMLIDMSKAVFFVYPYEDEETETFGAELIIRMNNEELRSQERSNGKANRQRVHKTRHAKR